VFWIYFLFSGLLAPAQIKFVPAPPLPAPTQLGEITAEELQTFDGTDISKPLLMAIKGQIYDVSQSRYVNMFIVVVRIYQMNIYVNKAFLRERIHWGCCENCQFRVLQHQKQNV